MVPEAKIQAAKKAQMARLGQSDGAGKKKRCKKGKSCGASCISNQKICWVDFPWAMAATISKTRDKITSRKTENKPPSTPLPSNPSAQTKSARDSANEVDDRIAKGGISMERGDKGYDWDASKGEGSKYVGEGNYGVVTKELKTGNLVKRGDIGLQEAEIIEKVGKLGIGPKLIASQEDGITSFTGSPDLRLGRVAMTIVPGEPIGRERGPEERIGGQKVADAYWRARAELHRSGVAHNDMHIENVLIDDKGKGRFVDFGLSINNLKAALSEAMGAFADPEGGGGDFQARRWKGTGGENLKVAIELNASANTSLLNGTPVLKRVWGNRIKVLEEMAKDGLSKSAINDIIEHGIESKPNSYKLGVWKSISDSQAQKYIDMLYEGV